MKKLLILVALIIPVVLQAQNEETRTLKTFSEVSVSQSIKLTLVKGTENKAEVITDGELTDVITEVSGGELVVKKESGMSWSGGNEKVEVTVTYTDDISKLKASSSSKLMVEGTIISKELEVKASSSARINFSAKSDEVSLAASSSANIVASVEAEEVEAKVSSSASIELKGNANTLEASASSSGKLRGEDFACRKANLASSSSGSISIAVKEELTASASSSGKVIYSGSPKIKNVNSSSGGKVKSAE